VTGFHPTAVEQFPTGFLDAGAVQNERTVDFRVAMLYLELRGATPHELSLFPPAGQTDCRI
jgi:hypothetical protein